MFNKKEYRKRYYIKNKLRLNQKERERYAKNRDKFLAQQKEWQRKNPERVKEIKNNWILRNPDYRRNYNLKNRDRKIKYMKEYYQKTQEHQRQKTKLWYKENQEKVILYRQKTKELTTKKRFEKKIKVYNHYSNYDIKCNCCGESQIEFLSIDHINNDGYKHRRSGMTHIIDWLIKNNFPSGFQLLCFNCNFAKGHSQDHICPHQKQLSENILKERGC